MIYNLRGIKDMDYKPTAVAVAVAIPWYYKFWEQKRSALGFFTSYFPVAVH